MKKGLKKKLDKEISNKKDVKKSGKKVKQKIDLSKVDFRKKVSPDEELFDVEPSKFSDKLSSVSNKRVSPILEKTLQAAPF